jgi:steroid delta-isomerase-like uncharacterized protein
MGRSGFFHSSTAFFTLSQGRDIMRYAAVLIGLIAVLAFIGCGDDDPVSSVSEEGINEPAGKLVISGTKAGGYLGPRKMRALHRAAQDAFNDADLDRQQSYYTDDIFFESLAAPPSAHGKEEFRMWMEAFYISFPDVQSTVLSRRTSGNILVSEEIYAGTHLGDFGGIPPTGQFVQAPILNVAEFEGARVKQQAHYWDMAGLMVQMGIMEAGAPPSLVPSFELPDSEPTGLSPVAAMEEFFARLNAFDLPGMAKILHQDLEFRFAALGMVPLNRDQFIASMELFFLAFPDLHQEKVRSVDLGDGWVLWEYIATGTQNGPYMGVPASGNSVQTRVAALSRFNEEGIQVAGQNYFDNLTILAQIGAVPAP